MKHLLSALAVVLLSACASGPEPVAATTDQVCRVDPQTGSNVIKRERCTITTEADREAARENARQAQDTQRMITPGARF